jgi:hypothetical protein
MSVELRFVNYQTVESAYRFCKAVQEQRRDGLVRRAWNAARNRDSLLLSVMQKGAEVLQRASENQVGAQGHDVGGLRVHATEFNLWREAYAACADGKLATAESARDFQPLQYMYVAGAFLAGYMEWGDLGR